MPNHAQQSDQDITIEWNNFVKFLRQLSHDVRNHLNAVELQTAFLNEIAENAEDAGTELPQPSLWARHPVLRGYRRLDLDENGRATLPSGANVHMDLELGLLVNLNPAFEQRAGWVERVATVRRA